MSQKKHWGKERLDGKKPPEFFEKDSFPAKKSWKKRFKCFISKGNHDFELIKPDVYSRGTRLMTVDEYYNEKEKEHIECLERKLERKEDLFGWCYLSFFFKCKHCGKREYSDKRELLIKKTKNG